MCIAVFVWQDHPLFPFLLLLNRDEYHDRPTKPISWWEDGEILGGRDEVAGGTWLACTRGGRLAFLTNVLEHISLPMAKSRGNLPVSFLKSKKNPKDFAEEVMKEADEYNGFNLILADLRSKTMIYLSNRPKHGPISIQEVSPGIHVLSNAKLDSPWHKARRLSKHFKDFLGNYGEKEAPGKQMVEKLMTDKVKETDETKLPKICSQDWEFELSSVFIEADTPMGRYGTRSSAAVTVEVNGEVSFYEKYLDMGEWKERAISYQIE